MAQVSFSSNSNTAEELRSKCIDKLADITDEVDEEVDKLSAAKEGDEQILQICELLREYQNRYNKKDTECTEALFLGLYAEIKSSIENALKKCPTYQESHTRLITDEVEPVKKEAKAKDPLVIDDTKEKTQQAKEDHVMSEKSEGSNGAGSPDGQNDSELFQTAISTNRLGSPTPLAAQNEVDDPGTSVKEQTIACAPSNLGHSKGKESGDHQKDSSQDSDQASCDPKGKPESQDLENGELSAGGPAPPDEPPLSNGLSPEHGPHTLQVSHLAGDASPVNVSSLTGKQPNHGQPFQQEGSTSPETDAHSQEAGEPFTANSLLGSTSLGTGLPPDPAPDSENGVTSLQLAQTPEGEPEMTGIKVYIIIGVIVLAIILLCTLLFKYACLRGYFSDKKKKKRQMIQEELDRLMNSPSIFDEKNMYLSYTYLEKPYEEYIYEY
ncbi:hypothetical protein, conserved [Plasmodium ovale]|uniref:PIR protein n=1 Tax=Plasmodium ovale TaxID=36330 RepID=A0A1C3KH02_PLAOA|nr:hypothetical protein, conserved [Plasmodium ovale]